MSCSAPGWEGTVGTTTPSRSPAVSNQVGVLVAEWTQTHSTPAHQHLHLETSGTDWNQFWNFLRRTCVSGSEYRKRQCQDPVTSFSGVRPTILGSLTPRRSRFVLELYYCLTNYPNSQWLKTINISCFSFCGSEIWEWLRLVVLPQGLLGA